MQTVGEKRVWNTHGIKKLLLNGWKWLLFPPLFYPSLPPGPRRRPETKYIFQKSNQRALQPFKTSIWHWNKPVKRNKFPQAHPKGKNNRKSTLIRDLLNESTSGMPTQNIWSTTGKLCERNPCWKKTARSGLRECLGSFIHHYSRECDITHKEQALKQSAMTVDQRQPEKLPRMRRDRGQEYTKLGSILLW